MKLSLYKEFETAKSLMAAIDKTYGQINYGPAVFAGLKVKVLSFSERSVWVKRDEKEFRIPRHWLLGNCRQGGAHVI